MKTVLQQHWLFSSGNDHVVLSLYFQCLFTQILIHGEKDSCEEMKKYCEENVCKTVSIAEHDKCLDITSDSSAFKVILKDNFAQTLKFQVARTFAFELDSASCEQRLMSF